MPGRKTDQKDAEWIAQLLQYGLLRPSYVPCEIIRYLRDLTCFLDGRQSQDKDVRTDRHYENSFS